MLARLNPGSTSSVVHWRGLISPNTNLGDCLEQYLEEHRALEAAHVHEPLYRGRRSDVYYFLRPLLGTLVPFLGP